MHLLPKQHITTFENVDVGKSTKNRLALEMLPVKIIHINIRSTRKLFKNLIANLQSFNFEIDVILLTGV